MTSEPTELFVWIWLPGASDPVVCGRLDDESGRIAFVYARSYRDRADAVPIYEPELPLRPGELFAASGGRLPLCIDDAAPDAWGRRLINHRLGGATTEWSELTYLLESGSDRVGALDFQRSAEHYEPRSRAHSTIDDMATASARIEAGEWLDPELEAALFHGTSVGGARPKALLSDGSRRLIAKFASLTDPYPVVQGEYVAMELARRAAISAAPVELTRAAGRYAMLVERFDRGQDANRKRVVSALTILGLTAFPEGRYASYSALAAKIRAEFIEPDATLAQLFARISFNILCGNTDDHGRNHAALLESEGLVLSPAYDICPQARSGGQVSQAMAFNRDGMRDARVHALVASSAEYHLDKKEAQQIVDQQVHVITRDWDEVCDAAELTTMQRGSFMHRQFLNPHAFER